MQRILLIILLAWLALCGAFYKWNRYLFFQPKKINERAALQFPAWKNHRVVKLPLNNSTTIDVVQFLPTDTLKGVVIFFHGNRYNVEHYSAYAPFFTRLGYACWMPDYPGFGRSSGEASVEVLKEISVQVYRMAQQQFAAEQITLYGKSLGSGIAAYLATQRDCRMVLLETPYQSLGKLVEALTLFVPARYLLPNDLETSDYLQRISVPVHIWHGSNDQLIPLQHATALQQHLKPGDSFTVIDGGRHNNLRNFAQYTQSLQALLP